MFNFRYKNPIFVVISNDIVWCERKFDSELYNMIYPGSSIESTPETDFNILMECDHHIVGFGTFALTSAFLGRGTIAYDAYSAITSTYELNRWLLCMDRDTFIPIDKTLNYYDE